MSLAALGIALTLAGCPDDPPPPPPAFAPEPPPPPPPPPPPAPPPPVAPRDDTDGTDGDVVEGEAVIISEEAVPVGVLADEFVSKLRPEAIVFNAPTKMEIDETVRLRLVLQPGQDGAALAELFERDRRPDEVGELETGETVLTADEMMAKLYSETLEVTILGVEAQAVSRSEPTEWAWTVKAVEGGPQRLTLTLYAIRPGTSSPRRIGDPLEYDMTVNVSMTRVVADFASANWEWLWTFIAAPLGGWWWQRRRKSR